MGLAWRQSPGGGHRQRPRSLTETETTETRDPVTSPPLPVPDRIARGQLSPKSWPQLFKFHPVDFIRFFVPAGCYRRNDSRTVHYPARLYFCDRIGPTANARRRAPGTLIFLPALESHDRNTGS